MPIACLIEKAINTHRKGKNYLFSTVTMVGRKGLHVTLKVNCLYLFYICEIESVYLCDAETKQGRRLDIWCAAE
jgi:hypothetical protein